MGQQLYAVGVRKQTGFAFRPPHPSDEEANERAGKEFRRNKSRWQSSGILPDSVIPYGHRSHERDIIVQYGITKWTDMFTERQLLFNCLSLEILNDVGTIAEKKLSGDRAAVLRTYLGICLNKCLSYNSSMGWWDSNRKKLVNIFDRP